METPVAPEVPPEVTPPPPPPPEAAARVFSACRESRLVGCDALYVRMLASSPELCVQLVLDNCDEGELVGLTVNTPRSWRLSSGSASTNTECDLRDYDALFDEKLELWLQLLEGGPVTWDGSTRPALDGVTLHPTLEAPVVPFELRPPAFDLAGDVELAFPARKLAAYHDFESAAAEALKKKGWRVLAIERGLTVESLEEAFGLRGD